MKRADLGMQDSKSEIRSHPACVALPSLLRRHAHDNAPSCTHASKSTTAARYPSASSSQAPDRNLHIFDNE
jgi:hypothetical protein